MGILIKPEDVPRLRNWASGSGAAESHPGRFLRRRPVLPWDQKATRLRPGREAGAEPEGERLSGGWSQPRGMVRMREVGHSLLRGSGCAEKVLSPVQDPI